MIAAWQAFKREGKVDVEHARKEASSPLLFHALSRSQIPFPFSFQRLLRRLYNWLPEYNTILVRILPTMVLHYSPPNFTTVHLSGSKVRDTYECASRPAKGTRCWAKIPGGGGTPYNGLYGADGEALPERGTFLRLQVNGRVGISLVEVYEMVAKSVISVWKGLQMHFVAGKKL